MENLSVQQRYEILSELLFSCGTFIDNRDHSEHGEDFTMITIPLYQPHIRNILEKYMSEYKIVSNYSSNGSFHMDLYLKTE